MLQKKTSFWIFSDENISTKVLLKFYSLTSNSQQVSINSGNGFVRKMPQIIIGKNGLVYL